MPMWTPEGWRHARRRHKNNLRKRYDRFKAKGWAWEALKIPFHRWRHMSGEKDWTMGRRKVPTDTGYGIAYEERHDVY